MTILEALQAGKIEIIRAANSSRWLYWGDKYSDEAENLVVRESRRGQGSRILIITKNEAEAIKVLIGEDH